jgi:hypothetical protein
MFIVQWIIRGKEDAPVRTEHTQMENVEQIFAHCQGRLLGGAMKNTAISPDGFIICDAEGNPLRQWIAKLPPID